ncbi:hypothetical protein RQP46_006287 [Phenoliferia psychrophenolica]
MQAVSPKLSTLDPHTDGTAHLTFSPDGRFLYTTGEEGYMRIFDATPDGGQEGKIVDGGFDDGATCVTASENYWCASSADGSVVVMSAGSDELVRALTRCTVPVRSARFDHKGKWIVVASDEVVIKVINSANPTQAYVLTGHKKGVRDATWSPDDTLITSTDQDGELRVWEIGDGEPTCIHVFDNLVFAAAPELGLPMAAAWHPSGKYFVVVSKDNELVIINRDGWVRDGSFSSPNGHTSQICALAWSKNGKYLVSAGKSDNVIVWSESTRKPVIWTKTSHQVTDIAFHPTPIVNSIAWIDNGGHLHQWADAIPSHLPDPSLVPISRQRDRSESVAASTTSSVAAPKRKSKSSAFVDDQASGEDLGDGDDDDDEEDLDDPTNAGLAAMEREEWIDDDLGGDDAFAMIDEPQPRRLNAAGEWVKDSSRGGGGGGGAEPYVSSYLSSSKGQDPFQPGATPVRDRKRYLAFNLTGNISVIEREDENIVTVSLHDTSQNQSFHFNDSFKYSLGAIGELGCIFACRSSGDSPATIFYRPYDSWSKVTEWQYPLSTGENPIALAVGGMADQDEELSIAGTGTVVVATDKGYLRFFTGSGIQKRVEHFDEVVAMAASKDWLLVVHRSGPVVEGKQLLDYLVLDMDSFETVQRGKIPIRKGATLSWIGFSDEQIPAIYDSTGVLSLLDLSRHPNQGKWLVALEMHDMARREGKDETYWPIGVTEKHVNAIILKGKETFPGFPTPLFQDLDLQFPLLRQDVSQGQLEEKYARETMFIANRRDGASPDDYVLKSSLSRQELEADKHLLKIIQTACKGENQHAAFDATLMLSQPASLAAAGKIAAFFHLPALEERIARAAEEKSGTRDLDDSNKRELKWTHRVDERVIPNATDAARQSSAGWFSSMPTASTPRAVSTYTSAAAASRRIPPTAPSSRERKRALQDDVTFDGSDDFEHDEVMHGGDGDGYDSQDEQVASPKMMYKSEGEGMDDGEQEEEEPETVMAPPPIAAPRVKPANPFAKKVVPKGPPAASDKKSAKAKDVKAKEVKAKDGKTKDVKRTNSFFDRVDEGPKTKAKGTKAAAKSAPGVDANQRMLSFAAVDSVPAPKKRKTSPDAPAPKKALSAFGAGIQKIVAEGAGREDTPAEDGMDEDPAGSLPAVVEEEEELELEDTQVDESQPVLKPVENTPVVEKEKNDGVSKLAQFRAPAQTVA